MTAYPTYYATSPHVVPVQPLASSRDWSKWGLAAAAIVGLGSSAFLLCRQYLPTVRLEYPPPQQPSQPLQQTQPPPQPATLLDSSAPPSAAAPSLPSESLSQPPQSALQSNSFGLLPSGFPTPPSHLPASSSSANSFTLPSTSAVLSGPGGSSTGADRLGLRSIGGVGSVLADVRTEELLLRGVSDVRSELSDIATQLKEQAQDNRRILTALQQTLDGLSRERTDGQHSAGKATADAHVGENSAQSRQGWETPASPRSSSRLSLSSPARNRPQPSVDTASSPHSGSGWALSNGRDSPQSAASTASTTPTFPQPALSAPLSPGATDQSAAYSSSLLPTATLNGATQQQPGPSLDSRLQAVRAALDAVQSGSPASSALSALSSLSMYVGNVSPLHEKCRKVQLGNASYQQRIARVQGAQDVLVACGFRLKGKALEWEPSDDKEADARLLAEARDAMATKQTEISARQQQQQHGNDNGEAERGVQPAASAPLASPLPTSNSGNSSDMVQSSED